MTLKDKMKQGPVFGMACYTGVTCIIENIGNYGLDFIYLDMEHTPWTVEGDFEKQIISAKLTGISVLVRIPSNDEVAIRKVLEFGADGVIIPHTKTKKEAASYVRAAKFPPMGRRGCESNVRAAGFGGPGFSWQEYREAQNKDTLVIVMDEDYEFTENIDEILSVPGIDAVNFGPLDYSNSLNLPVAYGMGEEVERAFQTLVYKAEALGIGRLGPAVPPTKENIENAIASGYNMIILGNDVWHLQQALGKIMNEAVIPIKNRT